MNDKPLYEAGDRPKDLFEAGLEFAESMSEFLIALIMLVQLILEMQADKREEQKKKQIMENLQKIKSALAEGRDQQELLQMYTLQVLEVADLLQKRRQFNNQPALDFTGKLFAHRQMKQEQIEASLKRRLKR